MSALLNYQSLDFEYGDSCKFGYKHEIEQYSLRLQKDQIIIPTITKMSSKVIMAPEFFEISKHQFERDAQELKDEGFELVYREEELNGNEIEAGKVGQEKILDENDRMKIYLFYVRVEQNDSWKYLYFKNYELANNFLVALEECVEDFYKDPSKHVRKA